MDYGEEHLVGVAAVWAIQFHLAKESIRECKNLYTPTVKKCTMVNAGFFQLGLKGQYVITVGKDMTKSVGL